MSRSLPILAALTLMAAAGSASAADYVVVESSVPALAQGATVTSAQALSVPANGRVVLIAASGQVVTVNGPFSGPPPAAGGNANGGGDAGEVLKVLPVLFNQKDGQHEIGAVRAMDKQWRADAIKTSGDVYAIDVSDGGDVCLIDPKSAVMMHNPDAAGAMTVQSQMNADNATLTWNKGEVSKPWPTNVALDDGDMFSFEMAGAEQATLTTIHVLPAPTDTSNVGRAVQLAQAGCQDQAKLLVTLIAKNAK